MTSRTTTARRRRGLRLAAGLLAPFALALGAPLPAPDVPRAQGNFAAAMGYVPEPARMPDGTIRGVKPTGACSAPTGATRYDFSVACKAHDHGYDRLRYASASGRPLGAGARRHMDAALARDLHVRCAGDPVCNIVACVYAAGAALNSWRQGYGPPVPEPAGLWAGRAALGLGGLTALRAAGSTRPSRSRTRRPR